MITTLVTHSGRFHADDLLAYAVLSDLFPNATLIRSRSHEQGPNTLMFDIGRDYDAEAMVFDHHQENQPLRDNDIPYSSFGLIWKHFGKDWLAHHALTVRDLHGRLDRSFVTAIDKMDNGLPATKAKEPHPLALPKMLNGFNALPDSDAAFKHASRIAKEILLGQALTLGAEIENTASVKHALQNRIDPRWMELPKGMAFLSGLRKYNGDDVVYVLFPASDEDAWYVSAVRKGNKENDLKKPFPESWAGQRAESLVALTGVKTATFCHAGRFLVGAQTREDALALLILSLETP